MKNFRAANELTKTTWDAISAQPHFKYAAVRIGKIDTGIQKILNDTKEETMVVENIVMQIQLST